MKKLITFAITLFVVLSGLGAVALNIENIDVFEKDNDEFIKLDFSSINVVDTSKEFISFSFEDEELYLLNSGQPMVPRILKQFELPFGVTNVNVELTPLEINDIYISKEIEPVPSPMPKTPIEGFVSYSNRDMSVYGSADLFPKNWYSYNVGCGLNKNGDHVTHLVVNIYPIRYSPLLNKLSIVNKAEISIIYDDSDADIFPTVSEYDLVIIAPSEFNDELQRLVDHKNSHGVNTLLKNTDDIYDEYSGIDEPEQIKYFIKDAIETWDIKYVLLVGGLKSILYAKPKDSTNHGTSGWYLPVRYANFQWDGDPSYNYTADEPSILSDLYFADIYKEAGIFEDWDSNGNGIFAEWSGKLRDKLDLYPDVAVGRLACRNLNEVKDVVNKIINYETSVDSSWFNRILVIAGDNFLDQRDWDIKWDTNNISNGEYTIFAQSKNPEGITGPIEIINITVDKSVSSNLSFDHSDHLKPGYKEYPAPPITEIVTISEGNILGNTDFRYTPNEGEAYNNDLYWWANISYVDGILTIRGKSYDPKPYGNLTDIHVWIENSNNEIIFTDYRNNTETYYEGEWITGEKLLKGRGGALYYMPDDFEKEIVWTSNGKWVDENDVMEAFSEGYGLVYFEGHGSPDWWGNHYPGIPGNRYYGQVAGLLVSHIIPRFPYFYLPIFPMNKLSNIDKLPVVCVAACHTSQFNVTLLTSFLDGWWLDYYFGIKRDFYTNTYGTPIPECWGWYMVKLPNTGAIATLGNTGFGWGSEGDVCTIGTGDGWINTEFFRQYGEENLHILGDAFSQTISSYISNHKDLVINYWRDDYGWDGIDEKTVLQWVLLGDPSLKIGGY